MNKKTRTKQSYASTARTSLRSRRRIDEVPTLYDILPPKSPASGREFARIVNLLLFHDGRRTGRTVSLFDDRAGDVRGLDAYAKEADGVTGYQHKFFPSPLSATHRAEIKESLQQSMREFAEMNIREKKMKSKPFGLKKWILITPNDFVESSVRKDAGDVSWFEGLRAEMDPPFILEHWGHTQLQALLLQTPSIGLYYYPELFPDGTRRQKTISGLRRQYDDALKEEHGRIEFVGMSVYKGEAAHTVLMERIYIPLSVIPNDADENDPNVARHDPAQFLAPGSRHVVLGDPGSGKTTLLRFLALLGMSDALQRRSWKPEKGKRFRFTPDDRLPVFVTLRRYTDALKIDDNLSLIEYIRANIEADFSITGITTEFLEYYLESGRTVLLFDGLDELPTPNFKVQIRNRIRHLTTTYPGNTTIVTSRVYGYQGPFRFEEGEFVHHRLAKLRDEEIVQFVHDWYDVRLEKPHDRREYLDSLLAILRNDQHVAIRSLARNPLLLTIMVLVHRIDAVLPDERHVLYQKCTETLLNTWHTWKFHEMDRLHRAKVDQQNMHRMQAIAYWMHHEMGGEKSGQQAVVAYDALHSVLSKHIATETPPNPQYPPEVIATAFMEFVQDRAGLLIEIGDRQFSFVHLTFQEYLTAARIRTLAELNGVRKAWGTEILDHCADPRWREVLRLLVAGYSQEAQVFLFDAILDAAGTDANVAQLLGGLLMDGVPAALVHKEDVMRCLLHAIAATKDEEVLRNTLAILRVCREKVDARWDTFRGAALSLCRDGGPDTKTALRLAALSSGWDLEGAWNMFGRGSRRETALLSLFGNRTPSSVETDALQKDFQVLWSTLDVALLTSPGQNWVASALQSLSSWEPTLNARRGFDTLMTVMLAPVTGPLQHYACNTLVFSPASAAVRFGILARNHLLTGNRIEALNNALRYVAGGSLHQGTERNLLLGGDIVRQARDRARDRARGQARNLARHLARDLGQFLDRDLSLGRDRKLHLDPLFFGNLSRENAEVIWASTIANPQAARRITEFLCLVCDLQPGLLWNETLAVLFLPTVPQRVRFCDASWWHETRTAFDSGNPKEADIFAAAWLLIFDGVMRVLGYHDPDLDSLRKLDYTNEQLHEHKIAAEESQRILAELSQQTRHREDAPLRIAHCLRDLCYGKESRAEDLKTMFNSDASVYREIFERCYWR